MGEKKLGVEKLGVGRKVKKAEEKEHSQLLAPQLLRFFKSR
jgi:hypothetical protein